MKLYDQHVHSYYSFDSDQPIKEYLDKAQELGLEYFILTEHLDVNYLDKGEPIVFDIDKEEEELSMLQKEYPNIRILRGIEIGYKPNNIKDIKNFIKGHRFDVINFSMHESDGLDYYFKEGFIERGIKKTLNLYFQRQLEMARNYDDYDVFCHLDFGFKTAFLLDNSFKINDYEETLSLIMKEIIKRDKALEINTKVQQFLPLEHTKYILYLYKKLGGKNLTLSSDAHKIDRFCIHFDKYISLIKECGFDHLNYFIDRKRYDIDIDEYIYLHNN